MRIRNQTFYTNENKCYSDLKVWDRMEEVIPKWSHSVPTFSLENAEF